MVMIRPPSARCSRASWSPWNTPLTLTEKLKSNSASEIWANGLVTATAALFTRMSHRPYSPEHALDHQLVFGPLADVGGDRERLAAGRRPPRRRLAPGRPAPACAGS